MVINHLPRRVQPTCGGSSGAGPTWHQNSSTRKGGEVTIPNAFL